MRLPWILGLAIAFGVGQRQRGEAPPLPVPVLVELFTAEGCSSCPPADVLLEKMLTQQPAAGAWLVGLGEHVDYWNQGGWKDRFSAAAFTRRQQLYAARSGSDNVYTPEMVVDGDAGFVGTDIDAARRAIERAEHVPHGTIRIALGHESQSKDAITVMVEIRELPDTDGGDPLDLLVAITEDGLRTDVRSGENHGRTLTHAAVVREMVTVASVPTTDSSQRATLRFNGEWRRHASRLVAFVQQRRSRRVLATSAVPLAEDR
jgi:hypothetical protein